MCNVWLDLMMAQIFSVIFIFTFKYSSWYCWRIIQRISEYFIKKPLSYKTKSICIFCFKLPELSQSKFLYLVFYIFLIGCYTDCTVAFAFAKPAQNQEFVLTCTSFDFARFCTKVIQFLCLSFIVVQILGTDHFFCWCLLEKYNVFLTYVFYC